MSEAGLARPEQRPAALRPSEASPSPRPSVPAAAPQPLLGNATTVRTSAGGGGRTPEQPGTATVAPLGSPADVAVAGQKADEVYAALNWLNQDQRALTALSGHGAAMRALIQQQFRERHGIDLATYLRSQQFGDSLVRASALLHSESYLEQHTRLALALIPPGVRSEEVLRLLAQETAPAAQDAVQAVVLPDRAGDAGEGPEVEAHRLAPP
jgi:hypothetical protein